MIISRRMAHLPEELAQQILDELALRMDAGRIRSTPSAYLAGLITRAENGTFAPSARRIARHAEKADADLRTQLRKMSAEFDPIPTLVYPNVASNPLCQRVVETQNKSRQRSAAPAEVTPPANAPPSGTEDSPPCAASDSPRSRPRPIFAHLARVIGNRGS